MKNSKILFITTLIMVSSCQGYKKPPIVNNRNIIKTYSSPSAYYGKPISRIFVNPYDLDGPGYYFDNDVYYIPPKSLGAIQRDNYHPQQYGR